MSGCRSRTRGGGEIEPVVEPPTPTENAERDEAGHDEHDEPARTGDGGVHTPEAGEGGTGTGVSQEAVTTAVLSVLSNYPEVVRRLLAVVSSDGGSGSASSTLAADGKLSLFMHQVRLFSTYWLIIYVLVQANSYIIVMFCSCFIVLLAAGASPLGDMPQPAELASLGLPLAPGG